MKCRVISLTGETRIKAQPEGLFSIESKMAVLEFDTEAFSSSLDWKQFEGLVEFAFKSFGYQTIKNYRMKSPRFEIDLLAISGRLAFAVDCKHWKRTVGQVTMLHVAGRQIKRCRALIQTGRVEKVVPLILTWRDEHLVILENGVAIVPIHKISDFLLNWESSSDEIRMIERSVGNRD